MFLEENGHHATQTLFMPQVLSLKTIVLIPELTGVTSQTS